MGKRQGVIRVTNGLIEELLGLPEGHKIEWVQDCDKGMKILISGPSLPEVPAGQVTEEVEAIVNCEDLCEKCGQWTVKKLTFK